MAHRHSRPQWDDQELHKLFAARLPVLAIPDEFAEQLMQSVLEEIVHHLDQKKDLCQDDDVNILASAGITAAGTAAHKPECDQANHAEQLPHGADRRKSVPPAIL